MCWNCQREFSSEYVQPKRVDTFSFVKVREGLETIESQFNSIAKIASIFTG